MADTEVMELEVKQSVDPGAFKRVSRFGRRSVIITGTFSATLSIEVSHDGTNWFAVHSGITAPAIKDVDNAVIFIRINTTVYASGAPVASVCGFDPV